MYFRFRKRQPYWNSTCSLDFIIGICYSAKFHSNRPTHSGVMTSFRFQDGGRTVRNLLPASHLWRHSFTKVKIFQQYISIHGWDTTTVHALYPHRRRRHHRHHQTLLKWPKQLTLLQDHCTGGDVMTRNRKMSFKVKQQHCSTDYAMRAICQFGAAWFCLTAAMLLVTLPSA